MAVPWTQLIRYAPHIITLSRELLQRSQRKPEPITPANLTRDDDWSGAFAKRIAALEENERRQAELVEQMAEQQAELTRAVLALHRRERLLIVGSGVAITVLFVLVVWALMR